MLCVGAVSASVDADSIDDSMDSAVLKTVGGDAALSDADDENIVSSGEAADALSVNNESDVLGSTGTYSDLANEIGAGGNIKLKHSLYTYDDSGSTITISGDNRVIDGNGAVIDMGGSNIRAFYARDSGVTIKNLTIKNANYTADEFCCGAAIKFDVGTTGTVTDCNFINNSAYDGGAIWIDYGSVENCYFENKSASSNGGAVMYNNEGTVTNSNFVDNSADGLVPVKTYIASVKFKGNAYYDGAARLVKVTVTKATPKLTASKKTFKRPVKIKKYIVTLKTNQNRAMKNAWVTLKVSKKTYKVKTNAKGQGLFKITNLNKKGTFTAVVKYAGNSYYNSKTAKQKIIVR